MPDKEPPAILRGSAFDIYCLIVKSNRPLGTREIQRKLKLSSPSVAQYNLLKLENAGLIKKDLGNYTAKKVILKNHIKISHFLIPKFLIYLVFGVMVLVSELAWFNADFLIPEYAFAVITTIIFVSIFGFETIKVRLNKTI